ncbi:hypothetical protein ASD81_06105 [Nocardioides sp. Root614]|nr:hypothetical protein ASD81_06105 [Nocardioides sp. Root614]KRA93367.1 hypothetical protein ASD84_06370 [Nocardioides sp. Root682]
MSPRSPTLWEEGRQPAQELIALAMALLLTATVLDLVLSDGLGLFYDLTFVTICVGVALLVRPADFFAVGVLPPLAMLLVALLLGISEPGAIARVDDGFVQATVSGLSGHALALAFGYAACLALLAVRRSFVVRHPR